MRVGRAMVVMAALCALGGCGSSDRDEVQAKVQQFLNTTATKDYTTLCGQVLASSLVNRLAASGIACEQAMRIGLSGVRHPILSIGRITVNGAGATAITLTGARGQEGSLDAIGLVKTAQGWRVASLGSPVTAPVSGSRHARASPASSP